MSQEQKRPVHEVRIGTVKAAVWEQETQHGAFHNVTFSRLYRDSHDKWQRSESFGRDDLLVLAKVADAAHTWIHEQTRKERAASSQLSEESIDDILY